MLVWCSSFLFINIWRKICIDVCRKCNENFGDFSLIAFIRGSLYRSGNPGLYILHPTMMVLISSCRSQLFCVWQRRNEVCITEMFNFGPNICGSDKKLRFAAWCCCSHCKFLCFDKNPAKTCKDVAAERGKEDNPEIKNAKYFENGKL